MKPKVDRKPTPEMTALLARSGSNDVQVATAAARELAVALTLPLRQGVLKGDITANIFQVVNFEPGVPVEFPLDFLSPGSEKDFVATTIANTGKMPERHVEGDFLMVPTYNVGATIDWTLRYSKQARWDIVGRALKVLEGMFVLKNNKDAWAVLLRAAQGRSLAAYDDGATAGLFTKRLVALMKTLMRRSAGGNSTSLNRGKLTDLYVSPESLEDIRSWDLTQVPDSVRAQIFLAGGDDESALNAIFGVKLHDIDELGVGQEFELYYENTLGGTLPSDKREIVLGLDLANNDSFVRPVVEEVELFENPALHIQQRAGMYGWAQGGWAALDDRRSLIGAL